MVIEVWHGYHTLPIIIPLMDYFLGLGLDQPHSSILWNLQPSMLLLQDNKLSGQSNITCNKRWEVIGVQSVIRTLYIVHMKYCSNIGKSDLAILHSDTLHP